MSYYLFLDDEREVRDVVWVEFNQRADWIIVRNYDEFTSYITEHGIPYMVMFDHDLADEHYAVGDAEAKQTYTTEVRGMTMTFDYGTEKTGFDCAKWLIDYCMDNDITIFPQYKVHSLNPVGKERIINLIENWKSQ